MATKSEIKRANQEAAGIPDSQPFISGEGRPDQERILACHCGGVLVSDLPVEMQGRLLYQQTDEGIAEANEGKTEARIEVEPREKRTRLVQLDPTNPEHAILIAANHGRTSITVEREVGTDPVGKQIEARRDFRETSMEPWEAPNPMTDLIKAYVGPGMSPKFLSPSKVDKDGPRGYEIVRYPNGDPVKLRNMPLGQMPQSKAAQRNKFYRDKSTAAVGDVQRTFMREGGKLSVDSET